MTDKIASHVNVLGTRIAAFNLKTAVDQIDRWLVQEETGRYVCVTGVHGVMEGLRDSEVRWVHNAPSFVHVRSIAPSQATFSDETK